MDLLRPPRNVLIGLIVLFVLLALLYAAVDLGLLGGLIVLFLLGLLIYFIVIAVSESRRRPQRPPPQP